MPVPKKVNNMPKQKLAIVTGASGYIAQHIIHQLLDSGWHVRGSVRSMAKGALVMQSLKAALPNRTDLDACLSFVELDLSSDLGWDTALDGCDALLHTASPFPLEMPKNENEIILPAVEGAKRALRSAKMAGVKRVIFTSSTVAIMACELETGQTEYTEENWTDLNHPTATAYVKSKTLAERAAWDFVRDNPEMEMTVINPGFVQGRPLGTTFGTSVQVIQRILRAKDPAMPDLSFVAADVRDIALMHVRALVRPDSIGKRFAGVAQGINFIEMAKVLKKAYPNRKIITRKAPYFLLKILSYFDPAVRSILPQVGKHSLVSNKAAKTVLGIEFRYIRGSIKDTANYLIENDMVD